MSKVCLVIGGTGGLGRACAEDLAKDYKVVVAGRNKSKGEDVVNAIKAKGGEAVFITFDICDRASITALHKDTVAKYGRLDAAVNGAGIMGTFYKTAEVPPEMMDEVWTVNVTGVFLCMQEQIKAMQANPGGSGGHIVNFSSIYGLHGCKWGAVYATSKHALIGMTKSAALEYADPKENILINAVAPGVILTEMTAALDPTQMPDGELKDYMTGLINWYPQRKFGAVEDVARGVRYLLESPWVTGTVLEIEGGFGAT